LLRVRLTRVGSRNDAKYRIVVADSKKAVKAKFISIVGWYNPHSKEISFNKEEVSNWLSKGAQPTNSVAKLLKKSGMKLPDWVKIVEKVKKPKKKTEEPAEKSKATEAEEASKEQEVTEDTGKKSGAKDPADKDKEVQEEEKPIEVSDTPKE